VNVPPISTASRAEGIKSSDRSMRAAVNPFGRDVASALLRQVIPSCYRDIQEGGMAKLVVRHLDEEVEAKLHRRPVKGEARSKDGLGTRIAAPFSGIGLREDEEIPEFRGYSIKLPTFD
jgi:hypothetical protein